MLNGRKVEIKSGGNFDPLPMDKYTVQCVDVEAIMQAKFKSSEEEEVLNYRFIVLDDKPMESTNEDGEVVEASTRGKYLWKRVRPVMNDKSWLYKLAVAAMGRTLTKDEAKKLDLESIVGKQVDVMVEQVHKDEKVFVNIVSFGKTLKPLRPVDESELKKTGQIIEKSTTPVVAPGVNDEADTIISQVSSEQDSEEEDEEIRILQAKIAAKKKAMEAKNAVQ